MNSLPLSDSSNMMDLLKDVLNEKWWQGFYMGALISWLGTVVVMSFSGACSAISHALTRKK